ncbi:hypothetical protein TNCV_1447351 [Trichonephila clavipes]|nr:hypothetical protein TNCV_1447351 [Trichonephila clavipes]
MRGTLTGQRYVDDMLRPHVVPFLNGLSPGHFSSKTLHRRIPLNARIQFKSCVLILRKQDANDYQSTIVEMGVHRKGKIRACIGMTVSGHCDLHMIHGEPRFCETQRRASSVTTFVGVNDENSS